MRPLTQKTLAVDVAVHRRAKTFAAANDVQLRNLTNEALIREIERREKLAEKGAAMNPKKIVQIATYTHGGAGYGEASYVLALCADGSLYWRLMSATMPGNVKPKREWTPIEPIPTAAEVVPDDSLA